MRRLIKAEPTRLWSVQELAHWAGLPLADAQILVEGLVAHGELVRKDPEHYTRPLAGGDELHGL
jgi:hypothetical protein